MTPFRCPSPCGADPTSPHPKPRPSASGPAPSHPSHAPSTSGHAPSTPSPALSVPSPAPPVTSHTPSAQSSAHPTASPAPLTAGHAYFNASPAPTTLAPPTQLVLGAVGSTVELPCHNAEAVWVEPRRGRGHRGVGGASGRGGVASGGGGGASSSEAPPDRRGAFWSWISRDGRYRGQVIVDVYPRGSARRYVSPLRPRAAMRHGAFLLGDFSLRLGPLRPGDAGAFTCRLHEAGSGRRDFTRTLRLETVRVVPSHRGPFSARSPLSLSCALSHWPQPLRVTWSLRGLPLATGPQPRRRRRLGDGGRSVAIRRLRLDDAGAWACHVTAPGGATATATFDLRFRDDVASPAKGVTTGRLPATPAPGGCRPDAAPDWPAPPLLLLAPGLLMVGMATGAGLALLVVVACRRSRARNDGTRA
ncbi:unnamed protein product [Lampetra fluviatilis]